MVIIKSVSNRGTFNFILKSVIFSVLMSSECDRISKVILNDSRELLRTPPGLGI